jgi:hypothetical protein
VAEVKAYESDPDSASEPELKRGKWIIDVEPNATIATTKLQPGEPDEPEEGERLFHSQMWVKGTSLIAVARRTSSLIAVARRTSSLQRSSSGWTYPQHLTYNPTPLDGSAKEEISMSSNNVDCHMASSPSKMRYCVMLLLSKFVMFFWANVIYGNVMLYMSLGLVVLLLL